MLKGKKFLLFIAVIVVVTSIIITFRNFDYFSDIKTVVNEITAKNIEVNLLFAGDILFDRGIDAKSQKSELKYAYPFQGLNTLERNKYDAWIGNLECPVTKEQSSKFEKEEYLKFSCKKEYLPELKKYFDIVSLANNHTNNMNGRKGIEETRKYLDEVGIGHFGDYDNSKSEEICKIINIRTKDSESVPIAFCGFHGVFQLPTDEEIKVINEYSKYFITFVMPHQGEEYKPIANSYQQKIYRKFIDNGADAVIGAHPHVIQNVEEYKGKVIFYSLGNFIFDQSWIKTRQHMTVDTRILIPEYKNNYEFLDCKNISGYECLEKAKAANITKPNFTISYKPIFTESDLNFVTKKSNLSEKDYDLKLKLIGFDKIDNTLKR